MWGVSEGEGGRGEGEGGGEGGRVCKHYNHSSVDLYHTTCTGWREADYIHCNSTVTLYTIIHVCN